MYLYILSFSKEKIFMFLNLYFYNKVQIKYYLINTIYINILSTYLDINANIFCLFISIVLKILVILNSNCFENIYDNI